MPLLYIRVSYRVINGHTLDWLLLGYCSNAVELALQTIVSLALPNHAVSSVQI